MEGKKILSDFRKRCLNLQMNGNKDGSGVKVSGQLSLPKANWKESLSEIEGTGRLGSGELGWAYIRLSAAL